MQAKFVPKVPAVRRKKAEAAGAEAAGGSARSADFQHLIQQVRILRPPPGSGLKSLEVGLKTSVSCDFRVAQGLGQYGQGFHNTGFQAPCEAGSRGWAFRN